MSIAYFQYEGIIVPSAYVPVSQISSKYRTQIFENLLCYKLEDESYVITKQGVLFR